jgi:protein-S-isoprenylcysteine O-methyltransferase Ste14
MLRLSQSLSSFTERFLALAEWAWGALSPLLVRYRVRLSVLVFTVLILEDVATGVRPHDVLDPFDPWSAAGVGLILFGLVLRSWAAGLLHKHDELTTTGPYRLMRHPLYAGSLALMIGICLIIGDRENLFIAPAFAVLLYVPRVLSEERSLANLFGAAWTNYASETGRFFPRRIWCDLRAPWQWPQWRKNREYNALAAMLLGLAALKVWHWVL